MQCCVPFCETTAEIGSESAGITFHEFPREVQLRAAWLGALGKQDSRLPDSAVVCSLHFLHDDIYETANDFRQLRTDAIPSTVQVCMICLDTDGKMFLMSKLKLDEAYEHLTSHPPYDLRNLKQTLCVQCAQRLINFSRFRDKSLKARALMMDLVAEHELITRQHITMINRTKHRLNSDTVSTKLEPDHYDLNILEQPVSEHIKTEIEETVNRVAVKTEGSCGSPSGDQDMEAIDEDDHSIDIIQDSLKCESAPFHCTLCLEEFDHEHAYMRHMTMHLSMHCHLQDSEAMFGAAGAAAAERWSQQWQPHTAVSCSSAHSSLIATNEPAAQQLDEEPATSAHPARTGTTATAATATATATAATANTTTAIFSAHPAHTVAASSASDATTNENNVTMQKREPALDTSNGGAPIRAGDTTADIDALTRCVVKLHDIFGNVKKNVAPRQAESPMKTRKAASSCASRDSSYRAPTQSEVPAMEYIEPLANTRSRAKVVGSKTLHSKTDCSNNDINRRCNNSSQNSLHTEKALFICDICGNMYNSRSLLVKHMQIHTKARWFTYNINQYKTDHKNHLMRHNMRTHTGERPYACELCSYKSARRSTLVTHMRTHTGEKPHSCELCSYKYADRSSLVKHMRTHTGERPYACELCDYKSAEKSHLVIHMRTHTGEKPHSCELCGYKSAVRSSLVRHMRTHTGERPYACELCSYKYTDRSVLGRHMKTHTGEKPHSCELCDYKSAEKNYLVKHMRIHTGEKLHSCKLCSYKSADKSNLVTHMRTHMGEKPYSCEFCEYKSSTKSHLLRHVRTHTGEKPYSCELCEYKSAQKGQLLSHMTIHTGEKSLSCS